MGPFDELTVRRRRHHKRRKQKETDDGGFDEGDLELSSFEKVKDMRGVGHVLVEEDVEVELRKRWEVEGQRHRGVWFCVGDGNDLWFLVAGRFYRVRKWGKEIDDGKEKEEGSRRC